MAHTDDTRFFEQVTVGDAISPLHKGPMTNGHLMRWSAAIENWHRIHYDQKFSMEHDKLPGLLVNGSWKQHVLAQMLKNWAGPGGWVWRLEFQYRGMDVAGSTLVASGAVLETRLIDDVGVVDCSVAMGPLDSEQPTTLGTGTVLLPTRALGTATAPWAPATLDGLRSAMTATTSSTTTRA
jgi:acyl dehydratase